MEWVRRYFDRTGKTWPLESAVLSIITNSMICAMGVHDLIRSYRKGDQSSFYWGIFLAAFGLFGILWGCLMVHAIARHRKAESRNSQ